MQIPFDRVLIAGMLTTAAPGIALAAPDRVRSVLPPPSLNSEVIRHRQPAQEPPPVTRVQPREEEALPAARPDAAKAQAAEPQQVAEPRESGISLHGTLDRLLGASDEQIAGKRKEIPCRQPDRQRPADRKAIESFYGRGITRRSGSKAAA